MRVRNIVPTITEINGRRIEIIRGRRSQNARLGVMPSGTIKLITWVRMSRAEIEEFVLSAESFIVERLAKHEAFREKYPPKKFIPGETFLFLGRTLKLCVEEFEGSRPQVVFGEKEIFLFLPLGSVAVDLKKVLITAVKKYAFQLIPKRLEFCSSRVGFKPRPADFAWTKNGVGNHAFKWTNEPQLEINFSTTRSDRLYCLSRALPYSDSSSL